MQREALILTSLPILLVPRRVTSNVLTGLLLLLLTASEELIKKLELCRDTCSERKEREKAEVYHFEELQRVTACKDRFECSWSVVVVS